MKLSFCSLTLVVATAAAAAQSISIASPPSGSFVTPGQSFSIEVDFPGDLTGIRHTSLVITHIACDMQICDTHDGANASLGDIMYSGDFTPSCSDNPAKPPHQNFVKSSNTSFQSLPHNISQTVTLPTGIPAGSSLLNVAHSMLTGAEAHPILESKNVSLVVQTFREDRGNSLAKTRWFWTTFVHDVLSVVYLCFVLATDLNCDL